MNDTFNHSIPGVSLLFLPSAICHFRALLVSSRRLGNININDYAQPVSSKHERMPAS